MILIASHVETMPIDKLTPEDKEDESPDTSDSGRIVLWSALSAASLASLVWLEKRAQEIRKHKMI